MLELLRLLVLCAFLPVSTECLLAIEIQGKVAEVNEDIVKIVPDGEDLPNVGDKVEIIYRIPGLDEAAQVGSGQVTEVRPDHILANIHQRKGKLAKGQQAQIVSEHPRKRADVVRAAGPAAAPLLPATPPAMKPPAGSGTTRRPGMITNSLGMRLVLIPAGEFVMGTRGNEDRSDVDDAPHPVRITRPFYLGVHETTVGDFRAFCQATGHETHSGVGYDAQRQSFVVSDPRYNWEDAGWPQTGRHPVVNVSWFDAAAFCRWLSQKEGRGYRLPTEAEWEYACRAGTTTHFYSGDDEASLRDMANVADTSFKRRLAPIFRQPGYHDYTANWDDGFPFTAPVGSFRPNRFGLYDMHGNVQEWCADWYAQDYYRKSPQEDPPGPATGQTRVKRGGDWVDYPIICRSSFRRSEVPPGSLAHFIGFRVACEPAGRLPEQDASLAIPRP